MNGRLIFATFLYLSLLCTLKGLFSWSPKSSGSASGHSQKRARADHTFTTAILAPSRYVLPINPPPAQTNPVPKDITPEQEATCPKPVPVEPESENFPQHQSQRPLGTIEWIKGVFNNLLWQVIMRLLPTPRASIHTKWSPRDKDPESTSQKPVPVKPDCSSGWFQETIEGIKGALNDLLWQSILRLFPMPPASAPTPTETLWVPTEPAPEVPVPAKTRWVPTEPAPEVPAPAKTRWVPTEPAPEPESTSPNPVPLKSERLPRSFQETLEEYHTITGALEDIKILRENALPLSWAASIWVVLSFVASWGPIVGCNAYVMAKLLRNTYPKAAEIADAIDNLAINTGRVATMIVSLAVHFGKNT